MISSKKNFIFLHIPKTGGNSIQDALRGYADDEIVTRGRHQDGVERFGLRHPEHRGLTKHATLQDYATALADRLGAYFVFTMIRNPYDKLVSHYFSPNRGEVTWDIEAFRRFVQAARTMEDYLRVADGVTDPPPVRLDLVDAVVRFENLAGDLAGVCDTIGIPGLDLPHRNKSLTRRPYRECYDDALRDYVARTHAFEISLGGYAF